MLRNTVREEGVTRGATEFIFNDPDQVSANVFLSAAGYRVVDPDLQ